MRLLEEPATGNRFPNSLSSLSQPPENAAFRSSEDVLHHAKEIQ